MAFPAIRGFGCQPPRKSSGPALVGLVPVRSGPDVDPQRDAQFGGAGHQHGKLPQHGLAGVLAHLERMGVASVPKPKAAHDILVDR